MEVGANKIGFESSLGFLLCPVPQTDHIFTFGSLEFVSVTHAENQHLAVERKYERRYKLLFLDRADLLPCRRVPELHRVRKGGGQYLTVRRKCAAVEVIITPFIVFELNLILPCVHIPNSDLAFGTIADRRQRF